MIEKALEFDFEQLSKKKNKFSYGPGTPKTSPSKEQFVVAMEEGGINIDGENITPIDFFSSSPDLSDDEIIKSLESYLGVENIENKLDLINDSIDKAREYIEKYLHLGLPKEIQNLKKVKNKNDILKIFKKTVVHRKGGRAGLSSSYCLLVSVTAAAFEFRKEDLGDLVKESEYVYRKIMGEEYKLIDRRGRLDDKKEKDGGNEPKGQYAFHRIEPERKGDYDRILIFNKKTGKSTQASMSFRGKSEDSVISKFLNKPEVDAKETYGDGIGFKFEVKSKDEVKELIPFLAYYFKENLSASEQDFNFDSTGLLDEEDLEETAIAINEYLDHDKEYSIKENKNVHSNKKFQAVKINGKLKMPKGGKEIIKGSEGTKIKPKIIERPFEIQIVLTENENENEFSHHSVYEAVKKLSIITRLRGTIPSDEYINLICSEASLHSGLSAEKIKNEYLIDESIIIPVKSNRSEKKMWAHKKTFRRLKKAGLLKNLDEVSK